MRINAHIAFKRSSYSHCDALALKWCGIEKIGSILYWIYTKSA